MFPKIVQLFSSYLVFPIVGIVILAVGLMLGKKVGIVKPKVFLLYLIIGVVALVIPALLGFMDYNFMPYGYWAIVAYALGMGWVNVRLSAHYLNKERKFAIELFILWVVLLVGYCFFALVFNLANELKYGAIAAGSLLMFAFPCLFYKTYQLFLQIPVEVSEIWYYGKSETLSDTVAIDHDSLVVVEVELFKKENAPQPTRIKAKAPIDMAVGIWFKRLINDYNRKSPQAPIEQYAEADNVGWVFYLEPKWWRSREPIDFGKSFQQNGIKPHKTIIVKRVKETITTN